CSAILWLMASNCRKPETPIDPLPPATQEGANTFGCYINGEPWVAEIAWYILDPSLRNIDAAYDEPGVGLYDVYSFSLTTQKVDSFLHEYMILGMRPVYSAENFDLHQISYSNIEFSLDNPRRIFKIDSSLVQTLKITTLDTERNICAGTFSFTLTTKDKSDTIRITDGRFDVRYQVW
ncbi:MAG: hypothetical protein JNJ57_21635, partial [Saprospiraceae bacterium]|nr:hypothetical protein [Saprospiraceae bacterium]